MNEYDFSTLNSSDLVLLVRDLLNVEEDSKGSLIVYKSFKEGRDKGIDLLYSTQNSDYEIIGQVKHYYSSGVPALLEHLRKSEVEKVQKLNPCRYVFATSLDLTATNLKKVKEIFEPYIKTLGDIYYKKSLNELLNRFSNVRDNHYKLWFSGTEVLRTLLNYGVIGRSEFKEEEIKKRFRLYIETLALQEARVVLEKNNFVIITGEPGVGKTTTAELLLYEKIADGYKLVYIYDDIKEAEIFLGKGDSGKVIFYFDDFLGHNSVEIAKAKGSQSALLNVLRQVAALQNKKFIFTTRTFILNEAVQESEQLRRFNIKAKESLIRLTVYNKEDKIQLLNNHIEESALSQQYKEILYKEDIQTFIVNHPNFSPRSVEFITSSGTVFEIPVSNYHDFIIDNFNNPAEIWRHAYEQQIDDLGRLLLNTMVSFGFFASLEQLEESFNARLDYEVRYNNYRKPLHAFRNTFRKLENGFIVENNEHFYSFINPSLVDFLVQSIKGDKEEVRHISESAIYPDQLITRLYSLERHLNNKSLPPLLNDRIINNYQSLIHSDSDAIKLALLIYYYQPNDLLVIRVLDCVKNWDVLEYDRKARTYFLDFLEVIKSDTLTTYFRKRSKEIFSILLKTRSEIVDFINLLHIANSKFLFGKNESDEFIGDWASTLLNQKIEQDVEDLKGYSNAQAIVDQFELESKEIKEELVSMGFSIKANLSEYGMYDWWEIGLENYANEQMRKED